MIIFKDVTSDDEVMSDSFKLAPAKNDSGEEIPFTMQCPSKMVIVGDGDIDIGCGDAFGGGAEDDAGDGNEEKVLDVVAAFELVEVAFTAKQYLTYAKKWMKCLRKNLRESGKFDTDGEFEKAKAEAFMADAQTFVKYIKGKIASSECDCYMSKSCVEEAGMVYGIWEGANTTPNFTIFTYGTKEMRV
jgi:hypothetical protein